MNPDKPLLLVVTSTFPRWADDREPRFVLDLCLALAGRYRILVLAPHCPGARRRERLEGIEVVRYGYFFDWGEVLAYDGGILPRLRSRPWLWALVPLLMAGLVRALWSALRHEPVALVHAHWMVPQALCARIARAVAGRRVPLICTAHGADVLGLRGGLAGALKRWAAAGCARVGVVSPALGAALVAGGVAADAIRLMPMGVAVGPDPGARQVGLVAFAGRLVEKKGVEVLLAAFAKLRASQPRARLCIAGDGPERAALEARARALTIDGAVEFRGAVTQASVRQLFAEASVAVMPSVTARDGDSEGLGLVMLEAMAAGCPTVVTDLPATRGVITDGVDGLVFPERDDARLAEALGRVLADPVLARQLGEAGRRRVEREYSWRAVADQHERVYREVLGSP